MPALFEHQDVWVSQPVGALLVAPCSSTRMRARSIVTKKILVVVALALAAVSCLVFRTTQQTLLDKKNLINRLTIRLDNYENAQAYAQQIESIAGYKTES